MSTDAVQCVLCGENAVTTVLVKRTRRSVPVEYPACAYHADVFRSEPITLNIKMENEGQMSIYDELKGRGV